MERYNLFIALGVTLIVAGICGLFWGVWLQAGDAWVHGPLGDVHGPDFVLWGTIAAASGAGMTTLGALNRAGLRNR